MLQNGVQSILIAGVRACLTFNQRDPASRALEPFYGCNRFVVLSIALLTIDFDQLLTTAIFRVMVFSAAFAEQH